MLFLAQVIGGLALTAYNVNQQTIRQAIIPDRLMGRVQAATLVVHGETERLVPPGNGRLIAQCIPGSKFVLIPHASHIYMTDQPEASHKAVMDFLLA